METEERRGPPIPTADDPRLLFMAEGGPPTAEDVRLLLAATDMVRPEGGVASAKATDVGRFALSSVPEAKDVLMGVCIGVSTIMALRGVSTLGVVLKDVPIAGTMIGAGMSDFPSFLEKFIEGTLARSVSGDSLRSSSATETELSIPGLATKELEETAKGLDSSAAPPAVKLFEKDDLFVGASGELGSISSGPMLVDLRSPAPKVLHAGTAGGG